MLTVKQQQFLLNNEGLIESKPRLIDLRDAALAQGLSGIEAAGLLILYAEASKLYFIEISVWETMRMPDDFSVRILLINKGDQHKDYVTLDYGSFSHRPSGTEMADLLRSDLSKKFGIRVDQIPGLISDIKWGTT